MLLFKGYWVYDSIIKLTSQEKLLLLFAFELNLLRKCKSVTLPVEQPPFIEMGIRILDELNILMPLFPRLQKF